MNGNIANGGIAVQLHGGVVFARPNEWFLNADDDFIYYCDRNDSNRLYKMDGKSGNGRVVIKKPCSGVTLFEDGIYFISEDDKMVYRSTKEGRSINICSKTKATEFAVLKNGAVFVKPYARRICTNGDDIFYADGSNEMNLFALTRLNPENGKADVFPDIKPSYINVYNNNVYYTDRNRQNMIFWLNPSGGNMSVYGGSAECLHIIGDWLYFLVQKKWKRLSLLNFGETEDVE